ncbi:DHS-like NAD/FAD-binding domain-containing protein [Rickenella mellea]|uniref:DHS-like NAD/FAD-binding domain-containing protein n=1 Tax=Rickenella mellea TaxID=50990 RepID=A0A4Y7Q020_9AGAM|nr:DHS-like NAD/FAD-binding domain-containing protein [Rickenella mellea]
MTIFLPLEPDLPFPQSPSFLSAVSDPTQHVAKVVKAVLKAKRIAVVCGAGISVEAGIPDFRSSDGLFQSIKRENPKEALSSGRDLFDASVFNSEHTTALFCQMIARLSDLSTSASPTYFHKLLRALDDRGKLLRVYTQNIDALELKAGLTFGVPGYDDRRSKSKTRSPKGKERADAEIDESSQMQDESSPSSSRLPTPPAETPRCIPLHGTLQTMHCQTCTHTFPLSSHTESLSSGIPPDCPECTSLEATRQLIGKRRRGVGKLRPSVVLYNEAHRDGEGVGEVARRDLVGAKGKGRAGADLLLVVGTSLRVPGTKRIVREFAKAVRARAAPPASKDTTSKPPTPTPSPRRSPSADDDAPAPIKTIYLNLDFPVPTREWDGVFDVWVQGDAPPQHATINELLPKTSTHQQSPSLTHHDRHPPCQCAASRYPRCSSPSHHRARRNRVISSVMLAGTGIRTCRCARWRWRVRRLRLYRYPRHWRSR